MRPNTPAQVLYLVGVSLFVLTMLFKLWPFKGLTYFCVPLSCLIPDSVIDTRWKPDQDPFRHKVRTPYEGVSTLWINAYLRDEVTFLRTQYAHHVITDSYESVAYVPVINWQFYIVHAHVYLSIVLIILTQGNIFTWILCIILHVIQCAGYTVQITKSYANTKHPYLTIQYNTETYELVILP